ncbi:MULTISPECIES: SNF2-related protein [Pectinatus]|uniref:SNF2-related protein n=1 Tax=Pectinatus TaxID=864 RepID=UPI001E423FB7|nr:MULTISPECIES: DEAD/DEAH box helicase [Pectinatus]
MPIKYEPRNYQEYSKNRIIDTPAIALMLDMGMGKTVSTLSAVEDLMYDRFDIRKVLVIAPLRVAQTTWNDECDKWWHTSYLKISVVVGDLKDRTAALNQKADIYTINRENVQWLVNYYGRNWPFDMIVIDESSSFKNPQAKRFKELKKVRPLAKRVVELTGTPRPNGLMDLWSQIYLLDRGERLGRTITAYRDKYFTPGKRDGHIVYSWEPKPAAEKEIYHRISDICISLKSEDYIKLPPIIYNEVKIDLPAGVIQKYEAMEKDLIMAMGDKVVTASNAAALTNKLLQMASGAVYDEDKNIIRLHDSKINALSEIVDCNEGKNIMVFYYFKHDLKRLKRAFPTARELSTVNDIRDWNNGKIKMVLVHPASAGHGLNLQHGGSIVVWFSLNWNLELYQQANKRLHRPGQKSTVVINLLIAKGTKDEDVIKALRLKDKGQKYMLEAIKAKIDKFKIGGVK